MAALFVVAAVLIAAAALLALGESALSQTTRVAVAELARDHHPRVERLARVMQDPARHLALLLLLRILCELGATACVTVAVAQRLGVGFATVGTAAGGMTVLSYVAVGVAPRTLGRQRAVGVALRAAGPVAFLTALLGPLARLLIVLGNALTPGRGFPDGPFASEAELRDLVEQAQASGVVERGERDMIANVFDLGDTLVREVMVPRPDIVTIEATKTIRQALSLALRSGFSRIPVIGQGIDDVVGVAYLKDLASRAQNGADDRTVADCMRRPSFVPDSKPVDELLTEMQAKRVHLAVVVDEYGGTAGIVTIEDILEEIVGEITDEYDQEVPPVEQVGEGTLRVTARLPVEDVGELFGVDLGDVARDVETVGGLLAQALGRVPIPGATVEVNGLVLTAERAAGRRNRIGTVLVKRVSVPADTGVGQG